MKQAVRSDWKTRNLPRRKTTLRLDRRFSPEEMARIRQGVIPEAQEDKWFIYWKDDALFFHRSWTGICIYVARFTAEGTAWRMVRADVNRDPGQYTETDDEQDVNLISSLIDMLLLHRHPAFPDGDSAAQSALMHWSLAGRAMMGRHPGDGGGQD